MHSLLRLVLFVGVVFASYDAHATRVAVIDLAFSDLQGVVVEIPPVLRSDINFRQNTNFQFLSGHHTLDSVNHGNDMARLIRLIDPNADIIRIKIKNTLPDLLAAIQHIREMPNDTRPKIVSLSVGSPTSCNSHLQSHIDRAVATGIIFVVSAGNDGNSKLSAPASCNNVIPVGSFNRALQAPSSFSNFSKGVVYVNEDLTELFYPRSYNKRGTSYSSAVVAGYASLIAQKNESITTTQLLKVLQARQVDGAVRFK